MAHTTRLRAVSPRSFLQSRFVRVAPMYWLVTFSVYLIAILAPSLLQATRANPRELLESFLFVPFRKSNGLVEPLLFVGWTLNYEIFFYLLFGVSLSVRPRWVGHVGVVCLLLLLSVSGWILHPTGVIASFYSAPILLEFAAGITLAYLDAVLRLRSAGSIRFAMGFCILGLVSGILLPLLLPRLPTLIANGLPAIVAVGSVLALHRSHVVLSNRLFTGLGDASYSIYLIHPFVTQAIQKLAALWGLTPWRAIFLIAVTFIAVCVLGVLAHFLVERPLTRAAKRLLRAKNSRATESAV